MVFFCLNFCQKIVKTFDFEIFLLNIQLKDATQFYCTCYQKIVICSNFTEMLVIGLAKVFSFEQQGVHSFAFAQVQYRKRCLIEQFDIVDIPTCLVVACDELPCKLSTGSENMYSTIKSHLLFCLYSTAHTCKSLY